MVMTYIGPLESVMLPLVRRPLTPSVHAICELEESVCRQRPMKKIALFADGTGNSSASPHKTNVWRAYEALDRRPGSGQVAFYDNGVGTSSFTPSVILGLVFGWGLARNVRQIYGFLCRTYDRGDEIYAFGFSRGAFTIRVVVALIAHQGIIDRTRAVNERDLDRLIFAAYRRFRQDTFTPSFLSFVLRPLRDLIIRSYHCMLRLRAYEASKNIKCRQSKAPVKFVGVWDTVDAYGLPVDELTRAWDMVVWPLTAKDRNLSPRVERARHALSLDEQRESFEPMLWNENGQQNGNHIDSRRLAQVWFPGVHANVGGGYPDDALAFAPLVWILDESAKSGLKYLGNEYCRLANQAVTHGPAYDSRSGYGTFYRYAPRDIERVNDERRPGLANWLKGRVNTLLEVLNVNRLNGRFQFADIHENNVNVAKPLIHHTVFDRILRSGDAYAPINVPADYAVLSKAGEIVDVSQAPYENKQQAKERRARQSWVWNKVWVRKFIYYTTLLTMAMFVAYPFLVGPDDAAMPNGLAEFLEPLVGTLGVVIRAIPDLVGRIPGLSFVGVWARQYSDYPFRFVIFLAVIGMLLICSRKVNAGIHAEMRRNWGHVTNNAARAGTAVSSFCKTVAGWRERYGTSVGRFVRYGVEAIAVLFLLFVVMSACSRLVFIFADGLGCVCKPSVNAGSPRFGEEFTFMPKEFCFDTGLELTRGEQYEIDFRISKEWSDQTITADVTGWIGAPAYMYGFTPLRRHLFVGWYEPMARVGADRFDMYPLMLHVARIGPDSGVGQERLVARFSARRSGRLYLYLNDAVLFTWGKFYRNNGGTAKVTVKRWRQ